MFKASIVLNIALLLLFGYLFLFSSKGVFLWNRSIAHPHTLLYKIEVEKQNAYQYTTDSTMIVMLGNSIIYECDWHELLKRCDVINRGIPGDNIDGIAERAAKMLESNPKTIVIMAGINNLLYKETALEVFEKYKALLEISSKATKLIVLSTLYTNDRYSINKEVANLNNLVAEYCHAKNITWLDLNAALAPEGRLLMKYSYDGLHLNIKGYEKWKQILLPYLPPIKNE